MGLFWVCSWASQDPWLEKWVSHHGTTQLPAESYLLMSSVESVASGMGSQLELSEQNGFRIRHQRDLYNITYYITMLKTKKTTKTKNNVLNRSKIILYHITQYNTAGMQHWPISIHVLIYNNKICISVSTQYAILFFNCICKTITMRLLLLVSYIFSF